MRDKTVRRRRGHRGRGPRQAALIWGVHIGMDRIFGYGLKYPTAFNDTHFARV